MALRGTAIPDYLTNENITGVSGLTEVGYMTRDADGTIDVRTQPSIPPLARYYSIVENTSGINVVTAQRIYAYPLDWTLDKNLDGLAINVTAVLSNIRFALYNTDISTGLPGGLLVGKPSFLSSIGANVQVFDQSLKFQQRIWVAFVSDGNSIVSRINGPGKLGTSISLSSVNDAGVYKGTTGLSLPTTFGTPDGYILGDTGPQMWWSNTLT